MGRVKLFTLLTKIGDPLRYRNKQDLEQRLYRRMGFGKKPLTEDVAKQIIDEYSADDYLTPKQKELYDIMRQKFEDVRKLGAKTMLESENKIASYIEQFRPINSDMNLNKLDLGDEEYNMRDTKEDFRRRKNITQTLDKQTTKAERIPLMLADQSFSRYMNNTIYYSQLQPIINKTKSVIKETKTDI